MQIQKILRIILSLVILLGLLIDTTDLYHYRFLDQLENWTYDARLNFTRPDSIDKRIVIVDIDENSLAEVGRWPWSRIKLAQIIDNLFDHYQIDVLGFDIVFAEADSSSGLDQFEKLADGRLSEDPEYLQVLDQLRPELQYDQIFAESLENRKIVMGYYFKTKVDEGDQATTGLLPQPIAQMDAQWSKRLPINKTEGYGANLSILQQSAISGGYFDNPFVDADGVFRRVPLLQEHDGYLYSSLALSTTRLHFNNPDLELVVEAGNEKSAKEYFALESVRMQNKTIPVDRNGAVYVPYRGLEGSFPYVPAADVLNNKADPAVLKNAIVLVGTSAPGLLDLRSTPVQNVFPGVEVHANIISGILDQTIRQKPAWTIGYEFVLLVLIGLFMSFLLPMLSPLMSTLVTTIILMLTFYGSLFAWKAGLILPLAAPMIMTVMMFMLHMSYGFFVESRGKRQLAQVFGQYIPPELVDEMSDSPMEFSLDGESREMTVLFSDVRGFTTISEGLDPKQLTQLMNALLTPMTRVIHKNRGTIDKYMGDAIMAFWGAPLNDPEHAHHALYAAMDMMEELKIMQEDFRNRGWPEVNIGIGLNTGVMNVGNMGSEFRMAYTVLGDAVNLGSRLEGLTKAYGVNIIVSETTRDAVSEYIFRELDLVRVKGKNEPVAIFEPVGHRNDLPKSVTKEIARYKQALKAFRSQQWDKAEIEFFNLANEFPDRYLYKVYQERIGHYRQNPPGADWDGVYTHTSK